MVSFHALVKKCPHRRQP